MSVYNAVNAGIYTMLQAGTALTNLLSGTAAIYYQQAPDGAGLDYAVFSQQAGGPDNITKRDTRNQLYFIRGYSMIGPAKAGSIDAQISTLLHRKAINVAGYANFWLARETDLSFVETAPNGNKVWMSGALYRIRLSGSV